MITLIAVMVMWPQQGLADVDGVAIPAADSLPSTVVTDSAAVAQPKPPHHGWLSILPPLIAILLAAVTRRVILSLLAGVFAGALIASTWNPLKAVYATVEEHVWGSLADGLSLRVIAFTLMMGAMVGVVSENGSMRAFVKRLAPLARNRRGGQLVTWFLGLLVFFDDYANTVILGNTMRPVTDRLRISRQKLAYLIDSTAAPIAGIALISTWIAVEIGYIDKGLAAANVEGDGRSLFIASIPSRLYVIWALVLVPLVAITGRDFGRMLSAERAAMDDKQDMQPDIVGEEAMGGEVEHKGSDTFNAPALGAVVPVLTVVAVFCAILFGMGTEAEDVSYLALFYAALSGLVMSVLLTFAFTRMRMPAMNDALIRGAAIMAPALAVLVLAWALSGVTKSLGCGQFISALLLDDQGQSVVAAQWLPLLVFVAAGATAFATGSSWATMGILVPMVIPVAATALGTEASAEHPLLIASVGSVLAGAVFGDHCSPISDTTVLSSQAAGCDHLAHVETQLPYALLVAGLVLPGLVAIGAGVPDWLVVIVGAVLLFVLLRVIGKRVEES